MSLSLSDDDVNVRVAAAEALGTLGRALGVDALHGSLRVALEADAPAVVAAAARALALAGDRSAAAVLREKLLSERAGVALAALEALRTLHEPLDALLPSLARHPDEEVVKQVLGMVMHADSDASRAYLGEGLSHPAWHVRAFAVAGLARSAGGRVLLEERARVETDPNVLRALQQALGQGPPRGER